MFHVEQYGTRAIENKANKTTANKASNKKEKHNCSTWNNQKTSKTMEAIVYVSSSSAYAKYNGHTFEIVEILSKQICLLINGTKVDFGFEEVLIVNVKDVRARIAMHSNANPTKEWMRKDLENLDKYIKANGIIM